MTEKTENLPLRQSMAWVHGWLGLLAGWILFAMFLTGTASYFRPEITRWMQPERVARPVAADIAAQAAIRHLQSSAPDAEQWYIYLPGERETSTRVFVRMPEAKDGAKPKKAKKRAGEIMLDPATGVPVTARETRGGEHFYRFHFQLQLPHPWGRWLAGVCAMFMLTAILSGVITHKRIFTDFFMLRWGKGQRSWLDAHNASAVLVLPFHAMITYTGLITLVAMYMPWPAVSTYKNPKDFVAQAYGQQAETEASGQSAAMHPIGAMVQQAMREWHGAAPRTIVIRHPGDAASIVTMTRNDHDQIDIRTPSITFSGASGQIIERSPEMGSAIQTAGVMLGLHMGHFAGPWLRWCYFLMGLVGAAMVGTGAVLWSVKRERQKLHFGQKLVMRLNIGAVACLPAGMAAYLLANRVLPADLPGRMDMEVSAMFWVWFGLAVVLIPLRPALAWSVGFGLSAVIFAATALADVLTNGNWWQDELFAAFDATLLLCAATLAGASWLCLRRKEKAAPQRRARSAAPALAGAGS